MALDRQELNGGSEHGKLSDSRPGCVPNSLIRGLFVEIGSRAFGDLVTEWFTPEHALEIQFRRAGLTERSYVGQGALAV